MRPCLESRAQHKSNIGETSLPFLPEFVYMSPFPSLGLATLGKAHPEGVDSQNLAFEERRWFVLQKVVSVQPESSSVSTWLVFQAAQNSEHILIYICNELVSGIVVSVLQMGAWSGGAEWTFVTAEPEESAGPGRVVTLFCFLGGRFSSTWLV